MSMNQTNEPYGKPGAPSNPATNTPNSQLSENNPGGLPASLVGRSADGGGIFRALIAIAGAVLFIGISLGFVGYAVYLGFARTPDVVEEQSKPDKTTDDADQVEKETEEPEKDKDKEEVDN